MTAAARIVLRDWSIGKFDRYTTPPTAPIINTVTAQSESSVTANLANPSDNIAQLYVNDETILSTIRTRKERRKQGGLVKFTHGSIDSRKVAVDEPWNGLEQSDDEESDDDGNEIGDQVDVEGMEVDDEDEDEEDDEEEEEEKGDEKASDAETEDSHEGEEDDEDTDQEIEPPHPSHKQKRKRGPERSMPLPPAKRVSFGIMPPARGSKSNHRQKIGSTTNGKGKLKERRSEPSPLTATPVNPVHTKISEKKGKIANVTMKIKAKGSLGLSQQSKDKSESEAYDFAKFF